ncbi:MAG: hypothetical protein ACK5AZ_12695 [Bryobacteraceae bacterium]
MKNLLTAKARLERGVRALAAIERRRIRRSDPTLGSATAYAIIQFELDELAEETRLNPASQVSLGDED